MRVIAGSLRGRRLQAPEAGDLRIRPTADRAREALFSILQRWPSGGFLDLFGGTGAVAVEAWSRGYGPVTCVEKAPQAIALIEANRQGTDVQLVRKDVRKLAVGELPPHAVLFADPPYDLSADLWAELAPRLVSWLQPGGVLVWETDRRTILAEDPNWSEIDARVYGAVHFHLFQRR